MRKDFDVIIADDGSGPRPAHSSTACGPRRASASSSRTRIGGSGDRDLTGNRRVNRGLPRLFDGGNAFRERFIDIRRTTRPEEFLAEAPQAPAEVSERITIEKSGAALCRPRLARARGSPGHRALRLSARADSSRRDTITPKPPKVAITHRPGGCLIEVTGRHRHGHG